MSVSRLITVAGAIVASLVLVPAVASAQAQPRVSITGDPGLLYFDIACENSAPTPVTITLRGNGAERGFSLDQPCGQWTGSRAVMPSVAPATLSSWNTADHVFAVDSKLVSRLRLRATGRAAIRRV